MFVINIEKILKKLNTLYFKKDIKFLYSVQ